MMTIVAAQTLISPAMLQMLLVIVILGLCLYLVQRFIPMAEPVKIILTVVVVLLIVVGLLRAFGLV